MDWLRKAPTTVIVSFIVGMTVMVLGVLGAYVVIALRGEPSDLAEFRSWIQTIGITVAVPLLGINTVATFAGGRAASNAEDTLNRQEQEGTK
jgi:hypothetical protein